MPSNHERDSLPLQSSGSGDLVLLGVVADGRLVLQVWPFLERAQSRLVAANSSGARFAVDSLRQADGSRGTKGTCGGD